MADSPLPHGGRLSKSGDNGIHRQLGAHPVHLVVYPIGNDIAGVFVQLHISEGVRVFQVFIRFGCKCCFEDRILLSHVVLPSQRSRITLALSNIPVHTAAAFPMTDQPNSSVHLH